MRKVQITRRHLLQSAGALAASGASFVSVCPAAATPEEMRRAIKLIVGDAHMTEGRVRIDVPPLVENGNTVPCTVTVESPMVAEDFVKAIHVFNEKNPQPNVISAYLNPRCGKATFSSRIRLSDTQTVIAIAEMSDGSFWSHSANVIITLGACLEDS